MPIPEHTLRLLLAIVQKPAWTVHFMHALMELTKGRGADWTHLRKVVLYYYPFPFQEVQFAYQVLLGIGTE